MNISKLIKTMVATATICFAGQAFAVSETWWNVDFTAYQQMGADDFTNQTYTATCAGMWVKQGADLSVVTNEFPTSTSAAGNVLNLNTQGEDLVWNPETQNSTGTTVVVDSDVYFVGSDSAPVNFGEGSIQTAVYLKLITDSTTGDVTGTKLCLYANDLVTATDKWLELDGVEIVNESWAHLKISISYGENGAPKVSVMVNDTQMTNGGQAQFTIANGSAYGSVSEKKLNSVAFRGTGYVDNFVATYEQKEAAKTITFASTVFADGVSLGGSENNENWNAWYTPYGLNGDSAVEINGTVKYKMATDLVNYDQTISKVLNAIRVYTGDNTYVQYDYSSETSSWTGNDLNAVFATEVPGGDHSYETTSFTFTVTSDFAEGVVAKVEFYYGTVPGGDVPGPGPDIDTNMAIAGDSSNAGVGFGEDEAGAETFVVAVPNTQTGVWYQPVVSTTIDGEFAPVEGVDWKAGVDGTTLTFAIPTAGNNAMFVKIKATNVQP